ncbi:MAG: hydrogenase formation protein HypD [Planctomycetes bacterium]|nr:hydrogenase formation protein HypD [Planctomycetota bacterium]
MTGPDPFHDRARTQALGERIRALAAGLPRPVTFMEVCGTHTHAIAAAGLRRTLPPNVRLVAGPGCPVCVTPVDYLDHALALAARPEVTIATFGDLLRVPASRRDSLERASARGADVRIVYSPRDALQFARAHPQRKVVFLAVGFETTMPTIAAALAEAEATGLPNFLILSGSKIIEPPLRALVQDPELRLDGFILPGHVSVILGADFYRFLTEDCRVAAAIVGFAPVDVQQGLVELLEQVRNGAPRVANLYARVVTAAGNRTAQALLDRFFVPADTRWRGLGAIPRSGLVLRPAWAHRDAARLPVELPSPLEPQGCRCGEVLRGTIVPPECPLFDRLCTPEHPVGACMVSSEGSCAAWHRHERHAAEVGR